MLCARNGLLFKSRHVCWCWHEGKEVTFSIHTLYVCLFDLGKCFVSSKNRFKASMISLYLKIITGINVCISIAAECVLDPFYFASLSPFFHSAFYLVRCMLIYRIVLHTLMHTMHFHSFTWNSTRSDTARAPVPVRFILSWWLWTAQDIKWIGHTYFLQKHACNDRLYWVPEGKVGQGCCVIFGLKNLLWVSKKTHSGGDFLPHMNAHSRVGYVAFNYFSSINLGVFT